MKTKAGIRTTEFWLTAAALAASAVHSLGLGNALGDVSHMAGSVVLAIVTACFGGSYMNGRLKLKSNGINATPDETGMRERVHDEAVALFRNALSSLAASPSESVAAPSSGPSGGDVGA